MEIVRIGLEGKKLAGLVILSMENPLFGNKLLKLESSRSFLGINTKSSWKVNCISIYQ